MKHITLLFCTLLYGSLLAQNQPPQITNLQTILNGDQISITYDLEDAEGDAVEITLRAGRVGEVSLNLNTNDATGDIGSGIVPGTGKSIVWELSQVVEYGPSLRIMLIADDLQPVNIQDIVDDVDSMQVIEYLSAIEGERHRNSSLEHLEEVQEMLKTNFDEHHLDVETHTFPYGQYEGQNIIGRMIGTDADTAVYIIDGHYDGVSNSPAADDNGSAVAGVLEAMRVLSKYAFRKTIKFIGFDLEEVGLIGSDRYVQNALPEGETLEGVLNFEMIGYYSSEPNSQTLPNGFNLLFPDAVVQLEANDYRGDFINIVADGNSTTLSAAYKSAIDNYIPELKYLVLDIPVPSSNVPDLLRSDHASFWAENLPAIMLTDGADFRNPYYHTAADSMGTLNFTVMSNVIKAAVATLAELAEVRHATTAWTVTELNTAVDDPSFCDIAITPNPAVDIITYQLKNCETKKLEVNIFGANGIRMYSHQGGAGMAKQDIDVSGWERGIYLMVLQKGKKKMTRKIILN